MKVHSTTLGLSAGAALAAMLVMSGCSREADRASRPEALTAAASDVRSDLRTDQASYAPRRESDRPARARTLEDGKPLWAANRRHTGEENARWQFGRNGQAFGAASVDDYVAKAHAFVDAPPKGALTAVRSNGDRLIYDAKTNVFVVADKDGAPRTMFKPRDGMNYWRQQKQSLADSGSGRGRRSYARSGDRTDNADAEG